jgi:streptogramin lyase
VDPQRSRHRREKRALTGCTNCHTVERILTSKYNAEEMFDVIKRMAQYSNNSFHKKPQIRAEARDINRFVPNAEKVAAYFASINRSKGEQSYELKTVPRVSGDGTRVVITEYDLPDQTIQPHDVITDKDGIVWHSDFSGQILGRLDTKTLEHKTFKVPLQRDGWPTGALDLETDPQGNLWLGLMFQSGTAKFDKKTEQFQMFSIPPNMIKPDSQTALIGIQNWTVDNKIWIQDPARRGVYRINVTSGETELFEPFANGPDRPIRSRPTRRTISTSSISAAPISAASTLNPARWRSTRRRPATRARVAAGSTIRAGCGSPSSSASASACSTPRARSSRSGRCRASSSRPMTRHPPRTGTCGPAA